MTPGFGWRPSDDPRDAHFPMRLSLDVAPPLASSLVYSLDRLLNQGATSTCVAHAWAHWLAASPLPTPGVDPYALYDACILVDEWPDNDRDTARRWGTSIRAGAKILQDRGHLTTYLHTTAEQEVRDFLLSGKGPVVVGTWWLEGMATPDSWHVLHPTGRRLGGHAYLLLGYLESGGGAYVVANSHGPQWGSNGRGYLTPADLGRLLDDGGEAVAAVEELIIPAAV